MIGSEDFGGSGVVGVGAGNGLQAFHFQQEQRRGGRIWLRCNSSDLAVVAD